MPRFSKRPLDAEEEESSQRSTRSRAESGSHKSASEGASQTRSQAAASKPAAKPASNRIVGKPASKKAVAKPAARKTVHPAPTALREERASQRAASQRDPRGSQRSQGGSQGAAPSSQAAASAQVTVPPTPTAGGVARLRLPFSERGERPTRRLPRQPGHSLNSILCITGEPPTLQVLSIHRYMLDEAWFSEVSRLASRERSDAAGYKYQP